jgi:hypothetical protein
MIKDDYRKKNNAYKVLIGLPEWKRSLGDRGINGKIILKKVWNLTSCAKYVERSFSRMILPHAVTRLSQCRRIKPTEG